MAKPGWITTSAASRWGRNLYDQFGFEPLHYRVFRAIFAEAKRAFPIHRNSSSAAHSWLYDVAKWQGTSFWRRTQDCQRLLNPRNLASRGQWRRAPSFTRSCMWDDILVEVFGQDWDRARPDAPIHFLGAWESLVRAAYNKVGMALPRCAVKEFEARSGPPPRLVKRVRIVDARDPVWPFTSYLQLEIRGDSSLVVNWTNAVWACKTGHVTPIIREIHSHLRNLWILGARPLRWWDGWALHVCRELNQEADLLAGAAHSVQPRISCWPYFEEALAEGLNAIHGCWDGSRRGSNAACGWLITARWGRNRTFLPLADGAVFLGEGIVVFAELFGCLQLARALASIVMHKKLCSDPDGRVRL